MNDNQPTDAQSRAEELQMEACLSELGGARLSKTLGDRILETLDSDSRAPESILPIQRAVSKWTVAALITIGVGVVGGTVYFQSQPNEPTVMSPAGLANDTQQDPKPKQGSGTDSPEQKPAPTRPKTTTLIADYSDNRVVEVDDQGNEVFVLEEVFGVWDAESLDSGNLLITEFSVSRVQEVNRKGETVWQFKDLKNPYDADRLPNGNTLIADTFAGRVIEVDADGQIVWSFAQDIRPFDCDRLPNGNTLIADVLNDRVIEVSRKGQIVWQAGNLGNVHDADRLANGNTLVTLRNAGEVREITPAGEAVWVLKGLTSPSDADRLPNGNTIVAENKQAREFDKDRKAVWAKRITWAVEVNRYRR
jgi:hypothetical protein